jgi:hypothetical protein
VGNESNEKWWCVHIKYLSSEQIYMYNNPLHQQLSTFNINQETILPVVGVNKSNLSSILKIPLNFGIPRYRYSLPELFLSLSPSSLFSLVY